MLALSLSLLDSSFLTGLSSRNSTSSLFRADSIGTVHRAVRVSIDCIGLVCVDLHVFFVFLVFFHLSPSFPFDSLGHSRDRATIGVLDLIIWYQQPLVSADLTLHPPNFVSRKFSKK